MSCMDIFIGVSWFSVYAKLLPFGSIHCSYVEVEKIDIVVLVPVKHRCIGSASRYIKI